MNILIKRLLPRFNFIISNQIDIHYSEKKKKSVSNDISIKNNLIVGQIDAETPAFSEQHQPLRESQNGAFSPPIDTSFAAHPVS